MEFWEESIGAFCVDEIVPRERMPWLPPYCHHPPLIIVHNSLHGYMISSDLKEGDNQVEMG